MEPGLIIAGAAGVAGLGIGLGTAVRLIPVYVSARGELKDFDGSSRAAVYDDMEMLESGAILALRPAVNVIRRL